MCMGHTTMNITLRVYSVCNFVMIKICHVFSLCVTELMRMYRIV